MIPPGKDLFNEVVVTQQDLFDWVAAVSPVHLTPERAYRNYVRSYNVAAKVASAKLDGTFWQRVEPRYAPWHDRLDIHRINQGFPYSFSPNIER